MDKLIFNSLNKSLIFILMILINARLLNINNTFSKIYSKSYKNNSLNKNGSKTSMKIKTKNFNIKLTIVLVIDSDLYKRKYIYDTLNSILCLNINYSLIIIYNKICPKITQDFITLIYLNFKTIFEAFNFIIRYIKKSNYITFLTPGVILKSSAYDFLNYIEEHDIYQIDVYTKKNLYEKFVMTEEKDTSNIIIYDLINRMPNNNEMISDKIYKISLLKKNNIRFIVHENSFLYFNLLSYSYAYDLLYINIYGILNKFQIKISKFYRNKMVQEENLFQKIFLINKTLTKNFIENMNKIDYVFPYVTTSDDYWQKLYEEYHTGKESNFTTGMQRFRDNGLLKYLFRGLEKYLPWINKVHMIVMSDSQVPNWINRLNVNIIYHSDFIPKKFLPSFSSSLIETFLPFLPFVEEKFIYGNDDLVPCRPLSKTLFFRGNMPCYSINIRDFSDKAPGDSLRRNAFNLIIGRKQNNRVISTQHSTISYRMSIIRNCYLKYRKQLLDSISRFREEKNFNQYIYAFYQMIEDTIINTPQNIISYSVRPRIIKSLLYDNFSKFDFICLNDEIEMKDNDWSKLLDKFEKIFPKKSKYEK